MSRKVRLHVFPAAALALAAFAFPAPRADAALSSTEMSHERYRVILEKEPFGPPPPKGPTQEELDAARRAAEEAAAAAAAAPEEPAYVIPPGLDKVKVTLLSRYRGTKAVGFLDGESGKPYFLFEGQEFDGFTCRSVDLENRMVTLAKAGLEAELPLWINPATTNCADVTTFGQPGGKPVDLASLPSVPQWELEQQKAQRERERAERNAERRAAREERRKDLEERRKRHAEEMASLTREEREQRMHDIAVDIIVNESGPPLPVVLNQRDLDRLEEEGFDVSAEREAAEEGPVPP